MHSASTLVFAAIEWNGAYQGLTASRKILAATFSAITPRTAGFFTTDIATLSPAASSFTIMLMIIGAGSGSTAGGIKVSTLAVIFLSVLAYIRGRTDINSFNRRIDPNVVKRAFNSAILYVSIALVGSFIIIVSQDFSLHDILFESFSAMGTVGLSRGITSSLNSLSKIVIIILMYAGRVGSMSIAMAFIEKKQVTSIRNPLEKVIIG